VHDVPRFPPLRRDLAFEVPAEVPAADVAEAIGGTVPELVDGVALFDVFEGPPLPPDRKSLAFAVDFRASDRTLTDADADAAVAAIVENVRARFGGELRTG
jgi:phenylalanyl-tRNA synthetase beta chain